MEELKVKTTIGKNIAIYRKRCNMTQAQMAEKLNYSDKAVSKWERGEGIPDVFVLLTLCEMFGITLNDLVSEKIKVDTPTLVRTRYLIVILSSLCCWLVATVFFVIGLIAFHAPNMWMVYIFALMAMFIVLTVFASMWTSRKIRMIPITGLIWSICLVLFLSMVVFPPTPVNNAWMVFLIGIPLEIAFLIFFSLKKKKVL